MAASPFERILSPKLLVGEGQDETRFFEAFLRYLKFTDVQVIGYGGKQKLKQFLVTLPRIPGFSGLQALGVTRDADDDPAGAAQSVDSALEGAGFSDELKVTRYIMPGRGAAGALESICLNAVSELPIEQCIEGYLTCAKEAGCGNEWSIGNAAKARLQAWLAIQNNPGLRLGEAAQAGLIQWESPAFADLRSFITNL